MFNFNPKGHAIIIVYFQCKFTNVIQFYGLYQIIRDVSPQFNYLSEEFSKSSISVGQ